MTPEETDAWLARTLEDGRLSRHERQALTAAVSSTEPGLDRRGLIDRAFRAARAAPADPACRPVLDWLEDVVKTVLKSEVAAVEVLAEAHFSPGEECRRAIHRLLAGARRTADVCVFTVTDDRLAGAVLDAHRRGVAVRVIADDSKADDPGSDVDRLGREGVPVRLDRSPFHMHHKFAVLDGEALLTGSYNWTRGAAVENEENIIVTGDRRLVSPFVDAFDRLWRATGAVTRPPDDRRTGKVESARSGCDDGPPPTHGDRRGTGSASGPAPVAAFGGSNLECTDPRATSTCGRR